MPEAALLSGENPHLLGCLSCGLVQSMAQLDTGDVAICRRCQAPLTEAPRDPVRPVLCWTLTALFLCVPAFFYPLFIVSALGIVQQSNGPHIVQALIIDHYTPLAAAVAAFVLAVPVLWLGALSAVLVALLGTDRPPWLGRLFRLVVTLDVWAMPEVFLLGGLVAYTRLEKVTMTDIGIGGWCYMALAFTVMLVRATFDRHHLWEAISPARGYYQDIDDHETALLCPACSVVLGAEKEHGPCPRCGATVKRRKSNSVIVTAALVLSACLLYIPANVLPVLSIVRFGREQDSTILGGALELIESGLWPLAMIVFMASIAVPVFKLFGLSWCLLSLRRGSSEHLVVRSRLYRIIELVGRWSNVDVFMIALLDALVNFGILTTIKPMPGALAFAAVVVITMIASNAFDPRLMWDAAGRKST
jgi:paraquat-inducible protein A